MGRFNPEALAATRASFYVSDGRAPVRSVARSTFAAVRLRVFTAATTWLAHSSKSDRASSRFLVTAMFFPYTSLS